MPYSKHSLNQDAKLYILLQFYIYQFIECTKYLLYKNKHIYDFKNKSYRIKVCLSNLLINLFYPISIQTFNIILLDTNIGLDS